jgi:large conductance mechanosensitive channel
MKGLLEFIREQGVVGLAVGFILGGAVSKVVASLVSDIINPILGIFLGAAAGLETASFKIGPAEIMYGSFFSVLIDFLVIALVVYYGVKGLGLEKLDKKKLKLGKIKKP